MGYSYDAEGRRVGKTDGTVYTITTAGDVLDEVNGAAPNPVWKRSEVYVGGKHLATVTSTTVVFAHGDWIGTERVRTNISGVICETTTGQPFGDNVQQSGSCNVSPDFLTGKPRDAESNLDDFGARYFSSQWGRWMSADWTAGASAVPYATLTNPQSLNLYAYVGNDPIDGQDPDGHAVYDKGPAGCAAYRSWCSAAGEYGDQASLDFEQLRIDTVAAEWNALMQARASAQGSASPTATKPASATAQSSSTAQQNQAQTQTPAAPPNSRTDVVLVGENSYTPRPQVETPYMYEMDWGVYAVQGNTLSKTDSTKNESVSLVESLNGGPFKPTGDPSKGGATDHISATPKSFDQKWFVGGKQVQVVLGKDKTTGQLTKAWEVHIVVNSHGDRPVYSASQP